MSKNAQNDFVIHYVKFSLFIHIVPQRMNFLALQLPLLRVLILKQIKHRAYHVRITGLLFKHFFVAQLSKLSDIKHLTRCTLFNQH